MARTANLPMMQETWVQSLGWEVSLKKGITTHSSIPAWKFHGQRSLANYSPQGRKESDTTEWLTHTHKGNIIVVVEYNITWNSVSCCGWWFQGSVAMITTLCGLLMHSAPTKSPSWWISGKNWVWTSKMSFLPSWYLNQLRIKEQHVFVQNNTSIE